MPEFPVLSPALQLGFYERLEQARKELLLPALLAQIGLLDIGKLDEQLHELVDGERLSFVARRGLRGELVFPVPYVLSSKPTLIGYYRLLLGFSQKEFYRGPFGRFKKMESDNVLTEATGDLLQPLCRSLIESAWILVNGLSDLSQDTLNSLALLTLGPQFRGSRNVNLGVEAIKTVFALIKAAVSDRIKNEGPAHLEVMSAANRVYRIEFSPDPDIAIRQILKDSSCRNRIAIEIKGGTDFSNIHNRLGEAEKSHQKAKGEGFTQFWTVINVAANIKPSVWRQETPTTNELFYLEQITDIRSSEYTRFKEYLVSELGI
ncbi:MAG: XcyI family restriction endonuclease [Anaerolineae bacterium]|nr:XcyI family restriction endonuclease [Anaerolineae bacterium]